MAFPKIDLNLLPCFQAVAETGSISKASQDLHLTQPAISLQIKKLEGEIGGRLFDRHNRGLVLTPLGSKLLLQTKQLTQIAGEIEHLNDEFHGQPRGVIKIGTYTTASSYLLPPVLANFLRNFPEITINYSYEPTEIILDRICNYELDCAVLSEVPNDPKLEIFPFFHDELVFVTSPKNGKSPKKIAPKDLKDFEYLSYPLRYDYCYRMVEQVLGTHLRKARVPIETTSFDTLKQSLLQGIGATFMPSYMIQDELASKKLIKVEVGNKKLPIVFSFVTKKGATLNRATLELREAIQRHFKI